MRLIALWLDLGLSIGGRYELVLLWQCLWIGLVAAWFLCLLFGVPWLQICWLFVFVGGYCLFAVVLGRVSWCSRFGVCLLFGLLLVLILWLVACYCVDWFLAADWLLYCY